MSRRGVIWMVLGLSLILILVAMPLLSACAPKEEVVEEEEEEVVVTPPGERVIKYGALNDLSGPAASLTLLGAQCIQEYIKYLNEEKGGIRGIPVDINMIDMRYELPLMISGWNRLVAWGAPYITASASQGGDLLADIADEDKVINQAAAGGEKALWPPGYTFIATSSNFPDLFGGLAHWLHDTGPDGKGWQKDRPLVLGIMIQDVSYARSVLLGGPQYVEAVTNSKVFYEIFPSASVDTTVQLRRLVDRGVDYIWVDATTSDTIVVLRDAYRIGLPATMMIGNHAGYIPEQLYTVLSREALDGSLGQQTGPRSFEDVPGNKLMEYLWVNYHGAELPIIGSYSATTAMLMEYVIGQTLDRVGYENLSGEAIYATFETMDHVDYSMGLAAPVTYTAEDHIGARGFRVYRSVYPAAEVITGTPDGWMQAPPVTQPWLLERLGIKKTW